MNYLVILDDGHGKDTSGKRTPLFSDGSYMKENEFNRDVVMRIYNKLQGIENLDVAFTAAENYDVPLNDRVLRANKLYSDHATHYGNENSKCILIAVHANAYGSGKEFNTAKGVETYCCPSPPEERRLAETIHKHLKGGTTQIDRGVQEICFAILKGYMTSCLVECAFMTNEQEAKLLLQEQFREECAEEIAAGIKEYFNLEVKEIKADYKEYQDGTQELKGEPLDLNVRIVNKSNRSIEEPYCVNGGFFWYLDAKKTKTYSTSIFIINGNIIQGVANHYYNFGCPQNVFIIYKNGKVEMKKVYFATELDYKNIKIAVGGVGLRDTTNPGFKYDPKSEGFKKGINKLTGKEEDQSGVLRKTNKTVIGYNKSNGKVYLLAREDISHGDLIKLISDNSTGEAYDIALSLDGGGSTFFNNADEMVIKGDGRLINYIIGFFYVDPRIEYGL